MDELDIDEILDRMEIKETIISILNNFESSKKEINIKRGIYIYGNPGTGKSYLVKSILKELDYDVILFDAGDIRNKSVIDTITKYNMADKNVLSMFKKENKKIAIIMDEIDGMNNGDKGGLNTLIKLIRPKKTKKQKMEDLTMIPILCIGNYDIDKKIRELMKVCHIIELKDPPEDKMGLIIDRVFTGLSNKTKLEIKNYVNSDLRKLNMTFDIFKKDNGDLNNINTIFQSKTSSEDVKSVTKKLLVNRNSIDNHNRVISETDRTIIGLLWHENIVDILSKFKKEDGINLYLQILDNLCFADYIDRITFQKQIWQFNEMSSLIKTFFNNYLLHNKGEDIKYNPTELRFTKVLTKYSTEYNNLIFIHILCQELNMDIKDMFGYFAYIKKRYNLDGDELYNKFFESYEITKLDISRMYRYLDYLNNEECEIIENTIIENTPIQH
ncbi:MAG: hypothetical protein CMF80_07820 [Candidatus Marinimicrobia bacterium]|nr:hypothetical protein [Candidatus Neomarinimicrobiota bacterium]